MRNLRRILASILIPAALGWASTTAHARELDPQYVTLGRLGAVMLTGNPDAPTVVYLHGYGGIGVTAFEAVREEIEKNARLSELNWIFPDAPRGGWFAILAQEPFGDGPDFQAWQDSLKPTRAALKRMLAAAKVAPEDVIWAGFSMGAITAIDFALHEESRIRGLVIDSGLYFDSTDWNRRSRHLRGVPLFMTHDRRDEMLPFSEAKKAEALLLSRGMVGGLRGNSLQHTLSPKFLSRSVLSIVSPKRCEEPLKPRKSRE